MEKEYQNDFVAKMTAEDEEAAAGVSDGVWDRAEKACADLLQDNPDVARQMAEEEEEKVYTRKQWSKYTETVASFVVAIQRDAEEEIRTLKEEIFTLKRLNNSLTHYHQSAEDRWLRCDNELDRQIKKNKTMEVVMNNAAALLLSCPEVMDN